MIDYRELESFKALNENQKKVFHQLHKTLIISDITISNKHLANQYHLAVKTIEHYLKDFQDAGLIERSRLSTVVNGKFKTIGRRIKLNKQNLGYATAEELYDLLKADAVAEVKAEMLKDMRRRKGNGS
ncbi:hypothetical protein LJC17_01440 [Acholeplasma sp. OttesenSCG-928-E16]|nr:hypothetical protein [Acholeplasma sp. OttesenSCG-928-E16]